MGELRVGLSEKQVLALLGAPLESKRVENRVLLEFAHHKEIGEAPISGVSISVVLVADAISLVSVLDVDASARCVCTVKECPSDWLKACEAHLPGAVR